MSNKTVLQKIFNELLAEIAPQKLIAKQCRLDNHTLTIQNHSYDLKRYNNIYLLGSGKAVIPMAQAVQELLKEHITDTLIVGAYKLDDILEKSTYIQSTHPIPSEHSIRAATVLQQKINTFEKEDLFIYLLSGGTSSLVESPEAAITLKELQEATSLMLRGGMPIKAINSVRKHLSQVKGGKLAKNTKAQGIVLVLSDVIGDDLHTIGSAPLYCDQTTFDDAFLELKTYQLLDQMPKSIQNYLIEGEQGLHEETPKQPRENIDHIIVGSNTYVLKKAKELLKRQGIHTTIIKQPLQGDVADMAKELYALAALRHKDIHCYILGGESTVIVTDEGIGGRNQHLCLTLLDQLEGDINITFLCAATDGIDGNSNAAGALIDMHSRMNALSDDLDPQHYLETFDSNTFFTKTGELLTPGPTHNNLLDIVIMLIEPQPTQGESHG